MQKKTDNITNKSFIIEKSEQSKKSAIKLPDYYTDIKPTAANKPEPPKQNIVPEKVNQCISYKDFEWVNKLRLSESSLSENIWFPAFHSQQLKDQEITFKTLSTILPVLLESINSPAMVRHCMDIIRKLTKHISPLQKQVIITGDQPV